MRWTRSRRPHPVDAVAAAGLERQKEVDAIDRMLVTWRARQRAARTPEQARRATVRIDDLLDDRLTITKGKAAA